MLKTAVSDRKNTTDHCSKPGADTWEPRGRQGKDWVSYGDERKERKDEEGVGKVNTEDTFRWDFLDYFNKYDSSFTDYSESLNTRDPEVHQDWMFVRVSNLMGRRLDHPDV